MSKQFQQTPDGPFRAAEDREDDQQKRASAGQRGGIRQYPGGEAKNSSIHHIEPTRHDFRAAKASQDSDGILEMEQLSEQIIEGEPQDLLIIQGDQLMPGQSSGTRNIDTIVQRDSDALVGAQDFDGTVAAITSDDVISMRKSRETGSASDLDPYRELKATPPPGSGAEPFNPSANAPRTLTHHIIHSSEQTSQEMSAASSFPQSIKKQTDLKKRYGDLQAEAIQVDDDAEQKLKTLQSEIVKLYLKIKRCSKDVSLTESQYLNFVESKEDKDERKLISQMDPIVVLQYINVSIDVIINLKFEDIETKMIENGNQKSLEATGGSTQAIGNNKNSKLNKRQQRRMPGGSEDDDEVDDDDDGQLGSPDPDELVVEDTPQKIRDKVVNISKQIQEKQPRNMQQPRKSKTQVHSAMHSERSHDHQRKHGDSQSRGTRQSYSGVDDSSSVDVQSCPQIYEEIIQQLEGDVRKHIRIEHQLKLHIESVEDRVEELERELDKLDGGNRSQHHDTDRESKRSTLHESTRVRENQTKKTEAVEAEIRSLREQMRQDSEEINTLKEKIREKELKEIQLRKEQTELVRAAEDKAHKQLLEMKEQNDDEMNRMQKTLDQARQRNRFLEESIKQLSGEVEMLKGEKEVLIEEQKLLMRRGLGSGEKLAAGAERIGGRSSNTNAGHSALVLEKSLNSTSNAATGNQNAGQPDLNMSGLSNLSNFGTQNKKMMKLFDQSDQKHGAIHHPQHYMQKIQTSLDNKGGPGSNAAKQFLVLEKQRFNSLEKINGIGICNSTTGGGPTQNNMMVAGTHHMAGSERNAMNQGSSMQAFVKQNLHSTQKTQNSKSQQIQSQKARDTAMKLSKIYNMATNGQQNSTGAGGQGASSKSPMPNQHYASQQPMLSNQGTVANQVQSPVRQALYQTNPKAAQTGSGRQHVPQGGASGGQSSSVQQTKFNNRNSSGLLYMHHSSLNNVSSQMPNQVTSTGSGQLKSSQKQDGKVQLQNQSNSNSNIQKMYQTQQAMTKNMKYKIYDTQQSSQQHQSSTGAPHTVQIKQQSRSLSKTKKGKPSQGQFVPKYIVKTVPQGSLNQTGAADEISRRLNDPAEPSPLRSKLTIERMSVTSASNKAHRGRESSQPAPAAHGNGLSTSESRVVAASANKLVNTSNNIVKLNNMNQQNMQVQEQIFQSLQHQNSNGKNSNSMMAKQKKDTLSSSAAASLLPGQGSATNAASLEHYMTAQQMHSSLQNYNSAQMTHSSLNEKFSKTSQQQAMMSKLNNYTQQKDLINELKSQNSVMKIKSIQKGASVQGQQQNQGNSRGDKTKAYKQNTQYLNQTRITSNNYRQMQGASDMQNQSAAAKGAPGIQNIDGSGFNLVPEKRANTQMQFKHNVVNQGDSTGGTKIVNKPMIAQANAKQSLDDLNQAHLQRQRSSSDQPHFTKVVPMNRTSRGIYENQKTDNIIQQQQTSAFRNKKAIAARNNARKNSSKARSSDRRGHDAQAMMIMQQQMQPQGAQSQAALQNQVSGNVGGGVSVMSGASGYSVMSSMLNKNQTQGVGPQRIPVINQSSSQQQISGSQKGSNQIGRNSVENAIAISNQHHVNASGSK